MIELSSLTVVFMIEATLTLFVLILVLFLIQKSKNKGEYANSVKVINKLQRAEKGKEKKLTALFSAHCELGSDAVNDLLAEVKAGERALFQKIIRIYLNKDAKVLSQIDKQVDKLSDPYCKALAQSSGGNAEKDKQYEDKFEKLVLENKRLAEQLTIAMTTMDEISAEYTRVFSGTQTEMELENSRKKMFGIFRKAADSLDITSNGES